MKDAIPLLTGKLIQINLTEFETANIALNYEQEETISTFFKNVFFVFKNCLESLRMPL